jgi:beta-glucosidase
MTLMTGYNRVDGSFMADHHRLVAKVLREEWGFDGLVMSDWGAQHDTVQSVLAGCDLESSADIRQRLGDAVDRMGRARQPRTDALQHSGLNAILLSGALLGLR